LKQYLHRALFALSCILSFPVSAIVNLESLHFDKQKTGFGGIVNLSISGSSGNTENNRTKVDAGLHLTDNQTNDYLLMSYEYGESFGQTNTDKSFIHLRHIKKTKSFADWEVFSQAERNTFSRLSLRWLLGAGARFQLNKGKPDQTLIVGLGGFYSIEELDKRSGLTDDGTETLWRANSYVLFRYKINDTVRFTNTVYYQPRFSDAQDYRLLEQATLTVNLSDQLDLTLSLDISHDSQPPQLVEKTDISYLTGITYRF